MEIKIKSANRTPEILHALEELNLSKSQSIQAISDIAFHIDKNKLSLNSILSIGNDGKVMRIFFPNTQLVFSIINDTYRLQIIGIIKKKNT